MQYEYVMEHKDKYCFEITTTGMMGKRFKEKYSQTPPMARIALDDWAGKGNQSVWYNSKRYRINIFSDILYEHNGFAYRLHLSKGKADKNLFVSDDNEMAFLLR